MLEFDASQPESLNEFERRLRSWRPSGGGLDRDRMLFEAGRASTLGRVSFRGVHPAWRIAAAAAAVSALVLGLGWRSEQERRRGLELAYEARFAPSNGATDGLASGVSLPERRESATDPSSYLSIAREIARFDLTSGPPADKRSIETGDPARPVDPRPLHPRDLDRVLTL